jgi:hypothetical protein
MADYIQKAPALDAVEHEAQVYNVGFTGQKSGQYVHRKLTALHY